MNSLSVQQYGAGVDERMVQVLQRELTKGGIDSGSVGIFRVAGLPGTVNLVWYSSATKPVNLILQRKGFETEELTELQAEKFLQLWEDR